MARNTWANKLNGTKLQYQDNYNTTRRGPRTRGPISNRGRITISNERYQITVQNQTYNQIAQGHNAILNWTVPEQYSAVILPSSVIYQQTHIHSEIQRKQQVCNHPFNGPKPHHTTNLRQRTHTKQQSHTSWEQTGDGPAPGFSSRDEC